MPPRTLSRHSYTRGYKDSVGHLVLTRAEPYRFRELPDNRFHTVGLGDTLFALAEREYQPIDPERAAGLWWVIADFQPDPIHDPTIRLTPGRVLVIPSVTTVITKVFDERRRISGA